jgi:hypothetical protein
MTARIRTHCRRRRRRCPRSRRTVACKRRTCRCRGTPPGPPGGGSGGCGPSAATARPAAAAGASGNSPTAGSCGGPKSLGARRASESKGQRVQRVQRVLSPSASLDRLPVCPRLARPASPLRTIAPPPAPSCSLMRPLRPPMAIGFILAATLASHHTASHPQVASRKRTDGEATAAAEMSKLVTACLQVALARCHAPRHRRARGGSSTGGRAILDCPPAPSSICRSSRSKAASGCPKARSWHRQAPSFRAMRFTVHRQLPSQQNHAAGIPNRASKHRIAAISPALRCRHVST